MKSLLSIETMLMNKAPALALSCLFPISLLSTGASLASGLCGANMTAERFVEMRMEEENDYEFLHSKDGGMIHWDYGRKASQENPVAQDHVLSFYDKSKQLLSKNTYPDEQLSWIMMGLVPTGNVLVATKNQQGDFIRLFNNKGANLANYNYRLNYDLDLGQPALDLQDGGLLFFGKRGEDQVAVKLSDEAGISWETAILDLWPSDVYPIKATRLSDESIVIISHGFIRNKEGAMFDQSAATRLDKDGKILWTKQFTNGFDDQLSDIVQLSDGSLAFAGVTRLADRYKGGKDRLWVFKTDLDGKIQKEYFLHEIEFAVEKNSGTIDPHPSGAIMATWSIWGPFMNDAEHQQCTYLLIE